MKLNWGSGILIFLILFLGAAAVFITFAMRQDVSLVDEDYYNKGVDYSEEMNVDERSAPYKDSIGIVQGAGNINLEFPESLVPAIDSGSVLMYRPSSSSLDVRSHLEFSGNSISIPKSNLVTGRYIVKLQWYTGGLKYEVDQAIDVR